MTDDTFWEADITANVGQWYAVTRPGDSIGHTIMTDNGALGAVRGIAGKVNPGSTIVMRVTHPLLSHPSSRFAVHPGGPKLRTAGREYPQTGFMRVAKSRNAGISDMPLKVIDSSVFMPANFCYNPVDLTEEQDQGQCGSCWAFAIAHMMADRVMVHSGKKTCAALSPRHIMECAYYAEGCPNSGCEGNDPYTALLSIQNKPINVRARDQYDRKYDGGKEGVNHADCVLPSSTDAGYSVTCNSVFAIAKYITTPGDSANKDNIQNIKQHIFNGGPVYCVIDIYEDFMNYDGLTIYEPSETAKANRSANSGDRHAVEIVGWGRESSGVSYWVCRNSWGNAWPKNHRKHAGKGFFYVRMGNNTCGIESNVAGADVIVHNASKAPKGNSDAFEGDVGPFLQTNFFMQKDHLMILAAVAVVIGGVIVWWKIRSSKTS